MRNLKFLFATLLALLVTAILLQAQLFEDFESEQKSGYAGASVELESGEWFLEDALIRPDGGDSDLKNGSLSVRIRDGFLRMNFDKSDGADKLSFYSGNSGFNGDGGGILQIYYSTDSGSNWNELGDPITHSLMSLNNILLK
ncbi:hypothetical protein [Rhodohalobacter sp.]|uniref:hypothetical protein n=1 Tax=Rhodohalobacter sp. TaxID=1974210 RepID=UPI002ACDA924|nr:hypothetical protein [Rhodohalobacter sp.]MDZ7756293.1 hypothetical protein [Rhodohalobacter sp.]